MPIRNRDRVSSHDLYQSISVPLHGDGLEEDLLQRDRCDVDRNGLEPSRLFDDSGGSGAREHRQDAPVAPHPLDPWRAERGVGRVAVEHELNPAVALAQIVERARYDRTAAIDDRDAVG